MPNQSTATSKKINSNPHKFSNESSVQSGDCMGSSMDRFQMISEAAYYHALGRGFNGGDQVEDWLSAESEINGILQKLEEPGPHSIYR